MRITLTPGTAEFNERIRADSVQPTGSHCRNPHDDRARLLRGDVYPVV
jgi:hypothetical protein